MTHQGIYVYEHKGIRHRFAALHELPSEIQLEDFFNCWTRKETYIEGRNGDLSMPLDQFDVSLAPGEPGALLNTNGDPRGNLPLVALESDPWPWLRGRLGRGAHDWRLRCWLGGRVDVG